jgi:hypothetical protein
MRNSPLTLQATSENKRTTPSWEIHLLTLQATSEIKGTTPLWEIHL